MQTCEIENQCKMERVGARNVYWAEPPTGPTALGTHCISEVKDSAYCLPKIEKFALQITVKQGR